MFSHPSGAFMAVMVLGVAACTSGASEVDEPLDDTSTPIVTSTRMFIVPTGAHARELCRSQINQYYCDETSATQATLDCLAKLPQKDVDQVCHDDGTGCLRLESVDQTCNATSDIYPTQDACATPVFNNCAFYSACVEKNRPCGESGYALGYGERYCTAFKNASFSTKGRAWMTSTMLCLQKALYPYTTPAHANDQCDGVLNAAFDSHPACYTQPSNSICFLNPLDTLAVLNTIGVQELFAARTLKQIRSVIGTCIGQIGAQVIMRGLPWWGGASSNGWMAPELGSQEDLAQSEPVVVPDDLDLTAQYQFWLDLDRQYASVP